VRGEVTIEVRTDSPDIRFAPGSVLSTDPISAGPLTVKSQRWHSGTLVLSFLEISDRNGAETLRNTILLSEVDPTESNSSEDDFHISQIINCHAVNEDGKEIGKVIDVLHLPGQDTLVIEAEGKEILIPFVREYVPEVDLEEKVIRLLGIEGLL